jgi:ABC-type branched-subunit amino acid transport system substrate-binding protein
MEFTKIGLLVGKTGPTALWTPSCINSAILGAAEANAAGGVMGEQIDLAVRDAGWDPDKTIDAALDLIDIDGASIVIGLVGSNTRDLVTAAISPEVPFIYTPTYERGRSTSEVISLSCTDDVLMMPLLNWIEERFHARRFFLVGSDFRWPRETMPMSARMISAAGNEVVGIRARPIDAPDDWDNRVIEEIKRQQPDIVLVFLVGDQTFPFYRAFSAAGLSSKIPRCAIATDETVLLGLGPDLTEGLFACAHYFATGGSDANARFKEHYWNTFGETAPIPNAYGQCLYEAVNYAVALMKVNRATRGKPLLNTAYRAVPYKSARFDSGTGFLGNRPPILIAEANGLSFDVVARF